MHSINRIPIVNVEMELTFQHLYDDNYGVIANTRTFGMAELVLIMPSKFTPRLGESYICHVSPTKFGSFVYKNKRYKLYIARRKDEGLIIDEIIYNQDQRTNKGYFKNNPFKSLKNLL